MTSTKSPSRREISAGGVVYRKVENANAPTYEVILCRPTGKTHWGLPKGLVDPGEDVETTARREVREESGVIARVVKPLGKDGYIYRRNGILTVKEVHYFLMEYESGDIAIHDHEMDAVEWVALNAAIERAAFEGTQKMIRAAREALLESA